MPYARMKNELPLIPGYSEGAIAYAPDAATAPLNECICYINPVQDLHGQDYPYPSGGGKNKMPPIPSPFPANGTELVDYGRDITFTGYAIQMIFSGSFANVGASFIIGKDSNDTTTVTLIPGYLKDHNGNTLNANTTYTNEKCTFILNSTVNVRKFIWNTYPSFSNASIKDIQFENGNTVTAYAPFSNICPITGHTELNLVQKDGNDTVVHTYTTDLGTTVYGGTLDVETGVLTKKYEKYKLGSSGWIENSGRYQHRYEGIMKSGSYYSDKGAICDTYPKLETLASGTGLVLGYNSDFLYFYVKDDFPTLADWTTYLENNDVYVTMPIATPTTTQLTPQEVKSLLGSNNFYHDCNGDTKITYIRRLDS